MRRTILCGLLGCLVASGAMAQAPTIEVGDLECLPNETNAVLTAQVDPEVGGAGVRLYFRRLNPVGAFYYVMLKAEGDGEYWTTFPKPESREQKELTDEWWEVLESRDWMEGRDREWLEDWLEAREHEAAEYYLAVYGADGDELARSETMLVEVWDKDECDYNIVDAKQWGWSQNMTVGETTEVQQGKQVFHWLCDGIVSRINWQDIMRGDEYCRGCVVAAIVPVVAGGLVSAAIIQHDPYEEPSPEQP